MDVNRGAPVVAESEITILAAPEIVWDLLADIEGWPRWNPAVQTASLSGNLAAGSTFRWKAGPGRITSTLRVVDRPRLLAWTGKTLSINAVHVYRLEPQNGNTLVKTAESWEGPLASIFRRPLHSSLKSSLDPGLRHLKVEAERRASL